MRILVFGLGGQLMGGIESFILNMSRYMDDKCIFDYIIIGEDTIHRKIIEKFGGRVFCVTSYNRNIFKNIKDILRVIENNKDTDTIAYFNFFSMVHMFPVILCKLKGYRVVIHAHNNNLENKSRLYRILHNFNRKFFVGMDCLRLTNSDDSTEFMFGKRHLKDAKLVYNAIEVDRFKYNVDARFRIRESLQINDKFVVGFCGRLSPQKNPLFVLEIFEQFYKNNPDSVLIMAGDGELRGNIEKSIKNKKLKNIVKLLGTRKDIQDVYSAMDLFLLPSLFEGLGIVLIEAQAAGLPIITTKKVVSDLVNVTELVNRVGLEDAPVVWADKMTEQRKRKFQSREIYAKQIKNSNFNIEKEAKKFVEILKNYGSAEL